MAPAFSEAPLFALDLAELSISHTQKMTKKTHQDEQFRASPTVGIQDTSYCKITDDYVKNITLCNNDSRRILLGAAQDVLG